MYEKLIIFNIKVLIYGIMINGLLYLYMSKGVHMYISNLYRNFIYLLFLVFIISCSSDEQEQRSNPSVNPPTSSDDGIYQVVCESCRRNDFSYNLEEGWIRINIDFIRSLDLKQNNRDQSELIIYSNNGNVELSLDEESLVRYEDGTGDFAAVFRPTVDLSDLSKNMVQKTHELKSIAGGIEKTYIIELNYELSNENNYTILPSQNLDSININHSYLTIDNAYLRLNITNNQFVEVDEVPVNYEVDNNSSVFIDLDYLFDGLGGTQTQKSYDLKISSEDRQSVKIIPIQLSYSSVNAPVVALDWTYKGELETITPPFEGDIIVIDEATLEDDLVITARTDDVSIPIDHIEWESEFPSFTQINSNQVSLGRNLSDLIGQLDEEVRTYFKGDVYFLGKILLKVFGEAGDIYMRSFSLAYREDTNLSLNENSSARIDDENDIVIYIDNLTITQDIILNFTAKNNDRTVSVEVFQNNGEGDYNSLVLSSDNNIGSLSLNLGKEFAQYCSFYEGSPEPELLKLVFHTTYKDTGSDITEEYWILAQDDTQCSED